MKIFAVFILSLLVVSTETCKTAEGVQIIDEKMAITPELAATPIRKCQDWERRYELLSESGKQSLKKDGIAFSGQDPDAKYGYYLLAPKLVSDCTSRVEIGNLIWLVVGGENSKIDKQFAEQNSKQIVDVLRAIWNAPGFSSDGTSHEKYLLLTFNGVRDKDIGPFIDELLASEGLNSGLVFTLISRPLSLLQPRLSELITKFRNKDDLPHELLSLIILQQISPNPGTLSRLERIAQRGKFPKDTRFNLKRIVKNLKLGKHITFQDLEELGFPLDD